MGTQYLADLGEARGCSTNSLVIDSLIQSVRETFLPTAFRRPHCQTVWDSSSSYKIDYVIVIKNFLNTEWHQNPINGSKVTAILLKGWILPISRASAVEGLRSTGLPRLVYVLSLIYNCCFHYTITLAQLMPLLCPISIYWKNYCCKSNAWKKIKMLSHSWNGRIIPLTRQVKAGTVPKSRGPAVSVANPDKQILLDITENIHVK